MGAIIIIIILTVKCFHNVNSLLLTLKYDFDKRCDLIINENSSLCFFSVGTLLCPVLTGIKYNSKVRLYHSYLT